MTLTGGGTSDGGGMTVDNVVFYKIDSTHKSVSGSNCVCAPGYYDDGSTFCAACISRDPGCNTCGAFPIIGFVACSTCQNGFYLNTTSLLCDPCQNSLAGCLQCSDNATCTLCNNTNLYYFTTLNSTQCFYCNSSLNYFPDSSLLCQLCNTTSCATCTNLTACTVCQLTYFLNSTS